ncbi:MAG: hydroxymethylbilane synthase [Candidatus Auribacter fodinae]|uniref:Hydroxymethylbilane synthase n=1 Tax=Candidatus Auribacter fodinae TaxID=2093366 RepID=A0A3A4QYZ4_9BACT|nr:MAG: hydroxymethylbilane synthase [Candidatus Auribacter fodinae]
MGTIYRVGTRSSPLALIQVDEILSRLRTAHPALKFSIVKIDTYGDIDKKTPISQVEGSDFFTREIDTALLNGDIDFAIHSAKDLPDTLPQGICIAAITRPKCRHDALVSKGNLTLDQLKPGAVIGTSSIRRKTALKTYRPDLQIADIRGTIGERLTILDSSDMDAVIIAACALERLGLEHRIAQRIPFDILEPHPLQGALAVTTRSSDADLIGIMSEIDEMAKE